jgi:hypothetical protein
MASISRMSRGGGRRRSSVLVGALMQPPLIPDRWNALLVGAVIFGATPWSCIC